ncbi:MAG TPA: hypothetical protein VEQ40_13080 [Pyrinomonadaceae bacterium]|nr:hypothetical protein [Pyrinomonadaceae bacterium]
MKVRKPFAHTLKQFLAALFVVALFSTTLIAAPPQEKLKAEDVIAKHLASIGTAEALAAVKSRVIVGNTIARLKLTNTPIEINGPVQFASEGDKVLLAMIFNSSNYSYEKAGYDGKDLTVGVLESGRRSVLSDFFFAHEAIFKQGLIGGSLSTAWPFLRNNAKSMKLSYGGTKKVNNRSVHELKFRNAGDLQVSLFFDAETFHHVRTEYKYTVPAQMGRTSTESAQQKESIYRMTEEFSDFKTESNLTLPHSYKLRLAVELPTRTQTLDFDMALAQFAFNQPVEAAQFSLK